ncbi:hypothetical protein OE88DRAFT_1100127 [Heliocybe sulcata]|uniref:Uncharacterized protein n=1 Tax=Heliocybe sulcata TaxID=5364 RepID=A0A5C3MN45_9AGAM|nr:hypothetical protein OE88DRAFT_1100127 [Heliocybe sulcata]
MRSGFRRFDASSKDEHLGLARRIRSACTRLCLCSTISIVCSALIASASRSDMADGLFHRPERQEHIKARHAPLLLLIQRNHPRTCNHDNEDLFLVIARRRCARPVPEHRVRLHRHPGCAQPL